MFTVFQGEGRSHFRLELANFRSFSIFSSSCKWSLPKVVLWRKDFILQLAGSLRLDALIMHDVIGQSCAQQSENNLSVNLPISVRFSLFSA